MSRLLWVALLVIGCGPSPGTFNGRVAGLSMVVRSATIGSDTTRPGRTVIFYLSDDVVACDYSGVIKKNSTLLLFILISSSPSASPGSGEYPVGIDSPDGGDFAMVVFAALDSTCGSAIPVAQARGMSGLVNVTALRAEADGGIQGTYDVFFGPQGDRVFGAFNAGVCPPPPRFLPDVIRCE